MYCLFSANYEERSDVARARDTTCSASHQALLLYIILNSNHTFPSKKGGCMSLHVRPRVNVIQLHRAECRDTFGYFCKSTGGEFLTFVRKKRGKMRKMAINLLFVPTFFCLIIGQLPQPFASPRILCRRFNKHIYTACRVLSLIVINYTIFKLLHKCIIIFSVLVKGILTVDILLVLVEWYSL